MIRLLIEDTIAGTTETHCSLDESERQLILMALGKLAMLRPGFQDALGLIADKFCGREMFATFIIPTTVAEVAAAEELEKNPSIAAVEEFTVPLTAVEIEARLIVLRTAEKRLNAQRGAVDARLNQIRDERAALIKAEKKLRTQP